MPFLDWVNKTQAVQGAAEVPYHLLQFESVHGDAAADNLLIQGDNLLALKALLPFYRGQVKCIYIDPPYNTQSAFEHYDDKLEHSQWLGAHVRHLIADRGISLTALVRAKHQLADSIRREIARRRDRAIKVGFQMALPGFAAAPVLAESFRHAFTFHPTHYPARPPYYNGRYRFKKHYYPVIHDLREKRADGTPAEEFQCARAIDEHPDVKYWVRNVEREERFSFWLPTAKDYFYPDFVCELADGRVLAVEYKGEVYRTNDDSREKNQIGHQWEITSGGKCLFLMSVAMDDRGRSVEKQIADKIAGVN